MRIYVTAVILSVLFSLNAFGAEGCGHDCKQCHKITEAEARKALSDRGDIKIKDIRMSPVKGLWQIMAERDHVKEVYYIDFELKSLFLGPLFDIKGKRDLTRTAIENATQVNISEIRQKKSLLLGSSTAATVVYALTDPSCPACAKLHLVMKQIIKKRPDIAFHIILFPLKGMKQSYENAKAVNCSNSLKMLEESLEGKALMPSASCSAKEIDDNMAFGAKYGIQMTPTIVFPNGKIHFGAENKDRLLALINSNLK